MLDVPADRRGLLATDVAQVAGEAAPVRDIVQRDVARGLSLRTHVRAECEGGVMHSHDPIPRKAGIRGAQDRSV